jgi:hypothetical protein
MRKLFGTGPMEVVMGPMMTMIKDSDQVAANEVYKSVMFTAAAQQANDEAVLAQAFRDQLESFTKPKA